MSLENMQQESGKVFETKTVKGKDGQDLIVPQKGNIGFDKENGYFVGFNPETGNFEEIDTTSL